MKKRFLLLSLLCVGGLNALVNPLAPTFEYEPLFSCGDEFTFKLGFRGDYVYNRRLRTIDDFAIFSNQAIATANFAKQADLYVFLGSQKMALQTVRGVSSLAMNFETGFLAGFGATAILYEWCCRRTGEGAISLTGQYEDTSWAQSSAVTINNVPVGSKTSFRYREGTVTLGIAQRICCLIPYVTFNWSTAKVKVKEDRTIGTVSLGSLLGSGPKLGASFGVSFVDAARMTITAEARLINEKAVTLCADFHF